MKGRFRLGKIFAVIFLTILIWVWADLAQDEKMTVNSAEIRIAKTIGPDKWVHFRNGDMSHPLEEVVVKGSASKISEIRRELDNGTLDFEFFLNPQKEEAFSAEGVLDVYNFVEDSDLIRKLGLTVESVKPDTLNVVVDELVKEQLNVTTVDESGNPIKVLNVEPAQVEMYVPKNWSGERLQALVMLTRREIAQARFTPIEKRPYIILDGGVKKEASVSVNIKTAPEEELLTEYVVTTGKLGVCLSANLQGKYRVQVENLSKIIQAIKIRSTPEAKRAYENQLYQVILEIADEDVKEKYPRREVLYNFPKEYIRQEDIYLDQAAVSAQFKLIPIKPSDLETGQ